MMMGEVEEGWIESVPSRSVGVALVHDGVHVIVEDLTGHAAKGIERMLVTTQQGLEPLVVDKLDIRCAAPSQRRNEHRQAISTAPNRGEIGLHLATRFGLKADQRLWFRPRLDLGRYSFSVVNPPP